MPVYRLSLLLATLALVAGCTAPPPGDGDDNTPAASGGPVQTDSRVHTIQLYRTGEEVSLPVLSLREPRTLSLEFDILDDVGARPLDIEFQRVDLDGASNLLPTEYLTGFERDNIFDSEPSGTTAIPYTHYSYSFPNASVGFKLGGVYQLRVSDTDGTALFERQFFVTEDLVEAEILLGTRLSELGAVGPSIQPSARLRPRGDLANEDAYRFRVCFARDGNLRDLRCAPDPSLAELAVYGFYLPRAQAFEEPAPLYRLDLGQLAPNQQITEVDYSARPPTALLEPDYAAFGGEFLEPTLITSVLVDGGYREGGQGDDDAEYVEVSFRYVPLGEKELIGPVYVRGAFNEARSTTRSRLTWNAEAERYERTLLIKQGVYAYDYVAPRAAPRTRPIALGQPTVFTAFVFYEDLTRFTERLVGITSLATR